MAIIVNTPDGNVLVDEITGNVLDSTGLAARNLADDVTAGPGPSTDTGTPQPRFDSNGNPILSAVVQPGQSPSAPTLSGVQGSDQIDPGVTTPTGPRTPKRVVQTIQIGPGMLQRTFEDGTFDVIPSTTQGGSESAPVSRQNQIDQLAQQNRQFQQNFDYNKEQDLLKQQSDAANQKRLGDQSAASLEKSKGDTLLGLGSRPDTLIKYLYAIRGQQTPQAVAGTTTNLPGYQNIVGQPKPGGTAQPGAVSPSTASAGGAPLRPPNLTSTENLTLAARNPAMGSALAGGGAGNGIPYLGAQQANGQNLTFSPLVSNGNGTQSFANSLGQRISLGLDPNADVQVGPLGNPLSRSAQANQQAWAASNPAGYAAALQSQNAQSAATSQEENEFRYDKGGVIAEPIKGTGLISGDTYLLGEEGPEYIVPKGKSLSEVKRLKGKRKDGESKYATGGALGFDPGFFNDPLLKDVVGRGYNSSPQTPLFPQIGIATNGGQSLVPSMQRLNSLLPSEQSLYAGTLQDEFGAQPDDIFALSRRLAPNVGNLRTPKFAN